MSISDGFEEDTKDSSVLVDLCKPYNVDLSENAKDKKRFFLGYDIVLKLDNEEVKTLFQKIYDSLSKLDENSIEEVRKNLTNIKEIVPFIYEKGKNEEGILLNLAKITKKDKISEVIKEIGYERIDPYLLNKHIFKSKEDSGNDDSKNNQGQYTHIYNIIREMHDAIANGKSVYVVVPHIPFVYIGKVKSLDYLEDVDLLAELLVDFYKRVNNKTKKDLKLSSDKGLFIQRDFLGQLIQSFEVEKFRTVNYTDLPFSLLMSRGQARFYEKDSDENKEFISIVKKLYETGTALEKKISKELILDWFTPTSIEELSGILIKYENKEKYPDLEIYHTGGTGDNGMDIIGTVGNEIKLVGQCKTDFEDFKKYYDRVKKIREENKNENILFYYIFTGENRKQWSEGIYNTEIWDKNKLTELIMKYLGELKQIPQYASVLNKYNSNNKF